VKPFTVTLSAVPDPVLAGTQVTLNTAANFNYTILSWSPSLYFSDQTATSQTITVMDTSKTFTVIAQSDEGCLDTASLKLTIDPNLKDFFIPNAFSPNGDGNNDLFKVYGSSIERVEMHVFNQWGQLLFESSDQQRGWDGTYDGHPQPVGPYLYVVNVLFYNNVSITRKGTVTLIR
jgi:gliding motility-associated-like protein